MSDYEIIQSCLDGNREAFSELITRYKKLIFSVIYNMIRDKQDLNDIAQEVFIKIYKSLDKYNPEYKFSTWSVKVATNYCLDTLRKKNVDQVPIEEISEVSSHDTPEEKYIKKERSEKIRKVIEELPEKYRIPIILFHKNGLSYEEMAEILNEPMTIIKNRLYRARLMLREKLAEDRKEEIL